jgi:hypothetical protein
MKNKVYTVKLPRPTKGVRQLSLQRRASILLWRSYSHGLQCVMMGLEIMRCRSHDVGGGLSGDLILFSRENSWSALFDLQALCLAVHDPAGTM